MKKTIIFLFMLSDIVGFCQQSKVADSLFNTLKSEKNDTNRVRTLNELSTALTNDGNYKIADSISNEALTLAEKLNYKSGECSAYVNSSWILYRKSDFSRALEMDFKGISIAEEAHDTYVLSKIYMEIGAIYEQMGDNQKAKAYTKKAVEIREKRGDMASLVFAYNNLGEVYRLLHAYDSAKIYYYRGIQIATKYGFTQNLSYVLGSLGQCYLDMGQYDSALTYNLKSKKLMEKYGGKEDLAEADYYIGLIYFKKDDIKNALSFEENSLSLAKQINERQVEMLADKALSDVYNKTNDTKSELKYFKEYEALKDTIFGQKNDQKMAATSLNFEYEKEKALAKADEERKATIADADKKKQKYIILSVSIGLLVVAAFSILLLGRYRITQKQKGIIEEQKALVEEKNKEVFDSISYAKRLQQATLPPLSLIKSYLPDTFVLYKPKDIVAGDFYWVDYINDSVLIAACDCTGHGVPGAMMSIVCSNAMNRVIREFNVRNTGMVLDKVRELVIETFEKSDDDVKDGMDISFCAINTRTGNVEWSGANNPLWYVVDNTFNELSPDKQPIGKYDIIKPFTTRELNLKKGSTLYLFTDGYADQFGGPKSKKFKYKQMKEVLLANASKPMREQHAVLNNTFEAWKGDLEQVDDILIIGVRI